MILTTTRRSPWNVLKKVTYPMSEDLWLRICKQANQMTDKRQQRAFLIGLFTYAAFGEMMPQPTQENYLTMEPLMREIDSLNSTNFNQKTQR